MIKQLIKFYPAIVEKMSPYCKICFDNYGMIPIVIDDAAMIVGETVHIVSSNIDAIVNALKDTQSVMTDDGHLYCTGSNDYEASLCSEILEKNAEVYIRALKLGKPILLDEEHCKNEHAGYINSYSKKEQSYQNGKTELLSDDAKSIAADELKIRKILVEYGHLIKDTDLVKGTWGNISIRLDADYMICTPSGLDYSHVTSTQMVKVNLHTLEYEGNLKPTSEKLIHASIYLNHPDAGAIVHTHSANATAYSVAKKELDLSGSKVHCADYGAAGTKELSDNILDALSSSSFGCFMQNHGMIVYGTDIEDAYQKAWLIENTATTKIDSIQSY